ncbi:23821_t:CDS:2 [Cetraspora pellucida]|uniref:23821_t:CDS:1 n=1 Tax=Cetraspora pellucida TaxID=1433469 RepID=A0A9N8Z745_9GLOM|nr:23821_t:CDS:2 [Cetraspora pellucida]
MIVDSINIEMSNILTFSELLATPIFSQNYTSLNLALTHNITEQSLNTEMSNMPMFSEPLSESLLKNTVPVFSQSLNLVSIHDITESEQLSDIEISNNMLSESLIESKPYKYNSILNYISQDTDETEESNANNESHEAEGLVNPTTDFF